MKREKRQDAFVRLLQGLEWVSRKRLIPPWQSQAFCISFILSSAILLPLAIKHGIYSPQLGPAHEHTRKVRFGVLGQQSPYIQIRGCGRWILDI